jgi:hypothetical protein
VLEGERGPGASLEPFFVEATGDETTDGARQPRGDAHLDEELEGGTALGIGVTVAQFLAFFVVIFDFTSA